MTREELLIRWRFRQQEWRRVGAQVSGASICQDVVEDLELLWTSEDAAELDLEEAASVSGYSTDHLRRLARTGKLPCLRRGHRMYFRTGDLPKKSVQVAELTIGAYNPVADARQVAAQRTLGGIHGTQATA